MDLTTLKNRQRESRKRYYAKNKEKFREYAKQFAKRNPEYHLGYYSRLSNEALNARRVRSAAWIKAKRKDSNEVFRLKELLRNRIKSALRRQYGEKSKLTVDLLGAGINEVRLYLEQYFTDGMTWEKLLNGEIHIDHRIPIAFFDLRDSKEQQNAFFYKNLQPLWASENLSKNSSIRPQDLELFIKEVGEERLPRLLSGTLHLKEKINKATLA